MKSGGVAFAKGEVHLALLEGQLSAPTLLRRVKLTPPHQDNPVEHCDWLQTKLDDFFSNAKLDALSVKLTLAPKRAQVPYLSVPLGVVALAAHKFGAELNIYSKTELKSAKRFALTKGGSPEDVVQSLKDGEKYWQQSIDAVLCGWAGLK